MIPWDHLRFAPLVALLMACAGCQGERSPSILPESPLSPAPATAVARLVIKEMTIDAGEIDFGRPQTYVFRVRNAGAAPLQLALVRKSCSCAGVYMPNTVPPGKEDAIELSWSPLPGKTGVDSFAINLETNDPEQRTARLTVKGRVTPLLRIVPEDWSFIDFNQVRPGQTASREIKVLSARLAAFQLKATISNPAFEVQATQLSADSGAGVYGCGHRIVLRTTSRLTSGFFRETLSLDLQIPGEGPRTITLPVYAEVENGHFEVRPKEIEFRKPRVADEDAKRVLVQFFVPSENESIRVARSELSFLAFDEPKRLKRGLWEFTVRLPASAPEAMRHQPDGFFEGRLFLKASGSDAEVPVRVKWVRPDN